MNIIETKQYGDTTVHFCDDHCREMSPKEIEKILKEISNKTLPHLQKKTA